uniref:Uncharacterized protein n=1 Tax=Anguilla anguilla TaxID=7936 RepID=A0A0E9WJJ9_ANGAN
MLLDCFVKPDSKSMTKLSAKIGGNNCDAVRIYVQVSNNEMNIICSKNNLLAQTLITLQDHFTIIHLT